MSVGLGNSIGPFLMAGLINGATWRHFYYLLCPLNVLVIVIIYIFIKNPVKKRGKHFDNQGKIHENRLPRDIVCYGLFNFVAYSNKWRWIYVQMEQ
mmetsp:Transcript_4055/g.3975  ORF Transcript_4055/g.3975 Transcript_4055/m.3975 type:complete len:96 (-) Transcript_4055:448-735(-)